MEREPKIGFSPNLPLDHEHVAKEIEHAFQTGWPIMIAESCRLGRKHLKLHRAQDGRLFVRIGRRGSGKAFIDRCDVTYLDGEPTLHQFKFVKSEWEVRRDERLAAEDAAISAKYGI